MSHYYTNDESLSKDLKEIKVRIKYFDYIFLSMPGVFSKDAVDYGTRILLNNLFKEKGVTKIADVGCGYGPIGLSLARENPKATVYMYDVNERAIELTNKNAEINGIKNIVTKVNDCLDDVTEEFELIITNPPIRAGKKTVFKIYEQSYDRLMDGGVFYCVINRKQGAPSTYKKLIELFGNCTKVAQIAGYWVLSSKKTLKS